MNFSAQSERKKPDASFQYFRAAVSSAVFPASFHTYGISKHLADSKTWGYREHFVRWPVTKEHSVSRPSFLLLDSQGECSKNEWVCESSYAGNSSSGNVGTLAAFSDILRRYADTPVCHRKPEPMKPCNNSLNITSVVKRLCEKSNFLFPCQQKNREKVAVASTSSDDIATSGIYLLQNHSKLFPTFTGITLPDTQPVGSVSSFQLQLKEQQNYYHQALQGDIYIHHLGVNSFRPVSVPYVVDFTDYGSAFKHCHHENTVSQLSVVRKSGPVDTAGTLNIGFVRHRGRQPKYNCRRKCLRVGYNARLRKHSAHAGMTHATSIDETASDLVQSDVGNVECNDSSEENELLSNDIGRDPPEYFSSAYDAVAPCDENSSAWFYSEMPLLPCSLCDIQEAPVQKSCSFASLYFISGDELDGSDFCSTDSGDSDYGGFLSPSSVCRIDDDVDDDDIATALVSGLSCIPFTDSWVMGCFGNCTPGGAVCEANARWNEAYSLPTDVLFETAQPHPRMV